MKRWIVGLVVLLGGVGLAEASITYNLVSPTTHFVVTGTITTDGHLGSIAGSNVIAWSWTVTSPTYSYAADSTMNGTGMTFSYGALSPIATASAIVLHYPAV